MENRPGSRKKFNSGEESSVQRRGEAFNTGKVGNSSRKSNNASGSGVSRGTTRGGGSRFFSIIIVVIVVIAGLIFKMRGGFSSSGNGSTSYYGSGSSIGWVMDKNTGKLDESVSAGAREKMTQIVGNGKDTVTIMVYMCGTDLESRSKMASSDLKEMMKADIDDEKVKIIVYTGGCKNWQIDSISNEVNQIYQVKKGKMVCLNDNAGKASMTNPQTLTDFIKWCNSKYPADRNELILWDHGGGSVSGYGYDEKNPQSGSMNLAGINKALKNAGVKFDFIGFDACLMATIENGLMLEKYADYMIASEETEPGIGWYYTDWLTNFSENTSMPTIEVGKNIADDFVKECSRSCSGQKTTLSVVDLAELKANVPDKFNDFASSVSELIENDEYKKVSDARYGSREFASSSKIDQVDLVNLAVNLNNDEAKALTDAVIKSVKYNLTSSNMTNAFGLSVYFPYRKVNNVDNAVSTYKQIGFDEDYGTCIKKFASLETTGQMENSGSGFLENIFGTAISSGLSNLNISDFGFLAENLLDNKSMKDYVSKNEFDADNLKWQTKNGKKVIVLSESQWSLVHDLVLNVFYDDGSGYIDMGTDNVFEFDGEGNLIGNTDGTWLSIEGQPVAYYYDDMVEEGSKYTITGYVPALLNGKLVNLILVFDNEHEEGYIAGARYVYDNGETQTVAKAMTSLENGDTLEFVCDFYSYSGEYNDTYKIGEPLTVKSDMKIRNTKLIGGTLSIMYRFTDIYNQNYWTEELFQN